MKSIARKSSKANSPGENFFEAVYTWVLQIPRGKVMSYGQIARLLDERYSPRAVGWAMHACPHDERRIPWHRVVNSQGCISTRNLTVHAPDLQQQLLEAEGIIFDRQGKLDMKQYQWVPDDSRVTD